MTRIASTVILATALVSLTIVFGCAALPDSVIRLETDLNGGTFFAVDPFADVYWHEHAEGEGLMGIYGHNLSTSEHIKQVLPDEVNAEGGVPCFIRLSEIRCFPCLPEHIRATFDKEGAYPYLVEISVPETDAQGKWTRLVYVGLAQPKVTQDWFGTRTFEFADTRIFEDLGVGRPTILSGKVVAKYDLNKTIEQITRWRAARVPTVGWIEAARWGPGGKEVAADEQAIDALRTGISKYVEGQEKAAKDAKNCPDGKCPAETPAEKSAAP